MLTGQSGHLWSQHQLYHPSPTLDAICGNIYETILLQIEPFVPETWPPVQQAKQNQWKFFTAQSMSCKRYIVWNGSHCSAIPWVNIPLEADTGTSQIEKDELEDCIGSSARWSCIGTFSPHCLGTV